MEQKKLLILISNSFPYKNGETFLESEVKFYDSFDRVIIYPTSSAINDELNFEFEGNITVKKNKIKINNFNKIFCLVRCLFHSFLYEEIFSMYESNKLNLYNLKRLLSFLSNGEFYYLFIKNEINRIYEINDFKIYCYAYWMDIPAFMAVRLKENLNNKIVSFCRCHRYDVYEYLYKDNYIPMRKYILKNIDKIFCISSDSHDYLQKKYPYFAKKMLISRLGTLNHNNFDKYEKRVPLRLLSCSWVRPVKRVEKILEVVRTLDIPVEWTHIGDGELLKSVIANSKEINKPNIHCIFRGAMDNNEIINLYSLNHYDAFVNLSESEGVPVSIMEAMSFGFPIIATDVGGTREIVIDGLNGYLIKSNFKISEVVDSINNISKMNNKEYENMCKASRNLWEEKCYANKNYSDFINNIVNI